MNIEAAKSNRFQDFFTISLLLIVIVLTTFPVSLYGMNWTDTSQIFHFANRTLHGDFPYRDFDYQTGFIGIVVDAFFQKILGEAYLTSLFARLLVKITTITFFYVSFRQFTLRLISLSFCSGWAFMHPILYRGGNDNYATMFLSISSFFIIIGLKKLEDKFSFLYLTIAGFFLALVVAARQSNGIICIAIAIIVLCAYSLRNFKRYFLSLIVPFLIGITLGLGSIIGFLSYNQALSEAFYHLFLSSTEKKNISTFASIVDALSGGAISHSSSIKEFIAYLVIPLIICILAFVLSQKPGKSIFSNIWLKIGIIVLLIAGAILGDNIHVYDLPRTFFSLALAASCIFPKKSQQFLGLPYPTFPLLLALTLGTTWAMQMSFPGRPYTDDDMLVFLATLTIVMSTKIPTGWKKSLSLGFLFITVSSFSVNAIRQGIGAESRYYIPGFYQNTRYALEHPITKFVKVTKEKAQAFAMLKQNINPGDSCFIYGSASALYTLLDCENPTNMDLTNSDALTLDIAREAVDAITAKPPKWIIDTGKGDFYIQDVFDGSPNFYGDFNQVNPKVLHTSLQKLISDYQLVSTVQDQFPHGEKLETRDQDKVFRFRLYKRKDSNGGVLKTGN